MPKEFTIKIKHGDWMGVNLKQGAMIITGEDIEVSDEYHTMHELYQHRMALNIALFNAWHYEDDVPMGYRMTNIKVMKSKLHHDGTMFEGYFVVFADTPEGQISYHYDLKHWDKFNIPEVERIPFLFDGHGSLEVIERLMKL